MKIFFLGDIVGRTGRLAVTKNLKGILEKEKIDFVIVNGENAADDGRGITREIAEEFFNTGIDVITSGNHIWDKEETTSFIEKENRLLRPANLVEGSPGKGFGFYPGKKKNIRYPHIGSVIIGSDVEIGCNNTIDRGSLSNTKIGDGTFLDNQVHIAHNVKIGKNCIINTGSIIEHDAIIGDNCHISTGAIINGGVKIGNNTFVGSGTVVRQEIIIGSKSFINANLFINKKIITSVKSHEGGQRNPTAKPCMPYRSPIKLLLGFANVFADKLAELPLLSIHETITLLGI